MSKNSLMNKLLLQSSTTLEFYFLTIRSVFKKHSEQTLSSVYSFYTGHCTSGCLLRGERALCTRKQATVGQNWCWVSVNLGNK